MLVIGPTDVNIALRIRISNVHVPYIEHIVLQLQYGDSVKH